MSKARSAALLGLVESEDEDSSEILESAARPKTIQKMPPAKRGRPPAAGRKPLAEKPSNVRENMTQAKGKKRSAPDDTDAHQQDDDDASTLAAKPKGARGRPRGVKAAKISDEPGDDASEMPEPAAQPARRGRKPKAQAVTPPAETEVPETQQVDHFDDLEAELEIPETQHIGTFDDGLEDEQFDDLPAYAQHIPSSVQRLPHPIMPFSASRSMQQVPFSASRAQHHTVPFSASRRPMASSTSELNDPSLRRRIGELTRKYESLELKYRDLRELGVKEAERNYDKLKKQGEERAQTANELIETLRAQLAAQTELAKEGERLKQQLEASEDRAAELQTKVSEVTGSLTAAKTEIKTLSTRLSASRAAEAANAKVPSSAIKGNNANNRMLANAEAAVQSAQMKEDLYADLTGLIVRGFKRENDDDVYDCLQTGRNGTLHFKLILFREEKTDDLDEVQVMYLPQLDESRDKDLLEILPDYLTEEITFPRPHAAKFYSRVMKFLTERLE
ncbi:hypothetical protein JX265_011384 [Neoarthrinium moseri]|uniref:Monopolin complex subunit Csm1/Pcs1 C-terminal domain-containing protein n=1 Tax=Neoarthrinium moseri TaxID=1658444 RepID=A0A9Q0AJF8_9PEZI|nr:hypothetical protein JX266_001809 [Neoarthrinium moseri]KAI1856743.1 hypothetical protein JX265_011384 [Neoarthrinium moseri]